ncbi:MAG: CHAT domain-containing protein [Bacteroidales bacterium]|nr:CHAT domain-containing protein [Bacteroidales bacterium]
MKEIILSIILAFVVFSGKGQNVIDSLIQVKNNLENTTNFDKKQYSETVNSLIFCFMNISNYYNAKLAAEEGIKILLSHGSVNDEYLRILYSYSGLVEYNLKNYVEAMNIFAKVEQMCQEANSVGDDYIIATCNAALICGELQHYSDMKNIMDAAVANYENKYGSIFKITDEKHFILLNNYGVANYYVGNNYLAGKCYRYVIDNCKGTFESNNALSLALINYSTALIRAGLLNQAANLLKKARTLNSEYAYMIAQNLVLANFGKWKIKQTAQSLSMFNEIAVENVAKIFADFPSSERENYWNKISMEMMALNNFVAYFHKNKDVLRHSFDMSLFCRILLLNSDKMLETSVKNSSNLALQKEFSELKSLKGKFIFNTAGVENHLTLKNQIEDKEEHIIHSISDLSQQLKQSSKTFENVKNLLNDGEYAVEYSLMYGPKDDGGTDTVYCMMVVGKNFSEPKIEFSMTVRNFDGIFFKDDADIAFHNYIYTDKTMALYKVLFQQFEKYIPNARTIYYSPCGKLSLLNFDLFMDENGTPLNQKYKMVRVSSTADIATIKSRNITSSKSAAIFGNINYDSTFYETSRGSIFGQLKNTEKEIHSICLWSIFIGFFLKLPTAIKR